MDSSCGSKAGEVKEFLAVLASYFLPVDEHAQVFAN
jgi:hypothetical protein